MQKPKLFHYTYVIIDLQPHSLKRWYIGKRSCETSIEDDWKYMSSSKDKEFKQLINEFPERFKKVVLNMFETAQDALLNEIFLHDLFDVGKSSYFYNQCKQTSTGLDRTECMHTEETKNKLREAVTLEKREQLSKKMTGKNNPMFGKHHTEEAKRKISIYNSEIRTFSEETRKKISIANSGESNTYFGITGEAHFNFGKTRTIKQKQLISKNRSGGKHMYREIHNNGNICFESKVVKESEINSFLENGWMFGCIRIKETKWIHCGINNKQVKLEELSFWLNDGWVIGRNKLNYSESSLQKMRDNKLGVPRKEETKKKISNSLKIKLRDR